MYPISYFPSLRSIQLELIFDINKRCCKLVGGYICSEHYILITFDGLLLGTFLLSVRATVSILFVSDVIKNKVVTKREAWSGFGVVNFSTH